MSNNINEVSLYAQQGLLEAQKALSSTVQKLSTGQRVNGAQDDAASLAISQNMVSQLNAVNQSVSNLNQATNLLQTADIGLSSIQDILLRVKQLSVQGGNDGLSNTQKVDITKELSDLNIEIKNTIQRTTFNNQALLSNYGVLDTSSGIKPGSTNVGTLDNNIISMVGVMDARPGIYKLSSNGANLTMTKTDWNDNTLGFQTVAVRAPTGTSDRQALNFGDFGIWLQLDSSTVGINGLTDSAEEIAKNLSNVFKPIVVQEGASIKFSANHQNTDLIAYAPINLTNFAKPDTEVTGAVNLNGISNTNSAALQVLASPTTPQGSYNITINESAAATEFELTNFTSTNNTVGINADFSFTVGSNTYKANGDKISNGVTTTGAVAAMSGYSAGGFNASLTNYSNWINSLNDNNVSARLYERTAGQYAIKVNGGKSGAANAVSFHGMTLVVADNTLTGADVTGTVSLLTSGQLQTSFNYSVKNPTAGEPTASYTGGITAFEGNNGQYLTYTGAAGQEYLNTNYASTAVATKQADGSLVINSELSPNPGYVSHYPYSNPYSAAYDQSLNRSSQYLADGTTPNPYYNYPNLGTRNQPSTASYDYGAANWNSNFTSNLVLKNTVAGIDIARDANLTINGRRITNETNIFTDATTGLVLNITTKTHPWDTTQSATVIVGTPAEALALNNSSLVALSQSIQLLKSFNNSTSSNQWSSAFNALSTQSDKAVEYISSKRSLIGSQLNRVSEINSNLRAQSINLGKSKSDQTDVDYAKESGNLGKGFIREYAATNAMKVANEMPSVVKTLMKLWDDIKP
jgi:flagellin-like hook-associated protein FlgL